MVRKREIDREREREDLGGRGNDVISRDSDWSTSNGMMSSGGILIGQAQNRSQAKTITRYKKIFFDQKRKMWIEYKFK